MAAFLFDWPDRVSLIIEDETEARARVVALEVAGDVPPSKVRRLPPRMLVLELFAEEGAGEDAPDVIVLRASQARPELLEALGELLEDEDAATAPTQPAPHLRVVPLPKPAASSATCESEADAPNGAVVRCELPRGHGKNHVGGELAWVTP